MTNIEKTLAAAVLAALPFAAWSAETMPAEEAPTAEQAGEAVEFSEAERRMWMTDQLASIEEPMVMTYRFERGGSYEPGFEDTVEFTVSKVKDDGMKAASLNFFTGERNFPIPPVESTNVNPVLGVYLQGDVYEMNRLTDERGKAKERWRYFHRQIKFALASEATVEPTTITFNGKTYEGHRITFTPYADDPHRDEFDRFADKRYKVVIADDLPGYLYEIETVIPGEGKDFDHPLIVETLKLESAEPMTQMEASRTAGSTQG